MALLARFNDVTLTRPPEGSEVPWAWTGAFPCASMLDLAAVRVVVRQRAPLEGVDYYTELHDETLGAVRAGPGADEYTVVIAPKWPENMDGPREHCFVFVESIG